MSKEKLYNNLDFQSLANNPDFKEDSVREVVILPLVTLLGYDFNSIVRSKNLEHPYLKIGSKKRQVNLVPDYLFKIGSNYAWVLDAKAPNEKIVNSDHIEQVYSYATHPEVRAKYFALCNGIEFSLFRTDGTGKPILFFKLEDLDEYWNELNRLLSINSFQFGKNISYDTTYLPPRSEKKFEYNTRPLLEEIPVRKRAAKRHFGVHGYFTKQSWNVVADYITTYSKKGDLVLDPFGGSGVTAIEAMMNGRKAISLDINPLAVFLVESLIAPVSYSNLSEAYQRVIAGYTKNEPKNIKQINAALKKYPYPKGNILPKGSDVDTVEKLFSDKQLAQLSTLKAFIKKEKDKNIRKSLLLMFSGLITKVNLTYHTSTYVKKEGGGDASAFRYYRYRLAPRPVELDILKYFELRYQKVVVAKNEIDYFINESTIQNIQILKHTATDLSFLKKESVDYIYTDPPYGKKIPYLDLSVMWNAWLDLEVTEEDYQEEAIEGGMKEKSKNEYNELIAKSIEEMFRVLKFDRWMSFVFAHKDPEFWHLIVETAESCGFEYVGAVPQKNGQTSFKKRQNPFTVLSGQLIINFRKVRNPKAIMKANLGMDIAEIVIQTIEGIIAKNDGATLEQINDELIIKGLELGFLDLLKKEYSDLTPLLLNTFDFDEKTELFSIKPDSKFKTHVDVKLRIKYYLISYLRRMERENNFPHIDEIVLHIIPLLKNGITPENQTILQVLEDIAERVEGDKWKLGKVTQSSLF
jgi:16S rRNA G966 N2-methylase RsmD